MKNQIVINIFLLALLFFCGNDRLQADHNSMIRPNQKFERLSIEQGLSQSTVYSILQDEKGFIWVATQDGLNRFDGYGFLVFNHQANNENSLAHNDLRALAFDNDGNLWIGTWGAGLDLYNPRLNRFSHFKSSLLSPSSLSDNKISCILQADSIKMWIGTWGGGLNLLDIRKKTFERYLNRPEDWLRSGNNEITSLADDGKGYLWVGTSGGLVFIRLGKKKTVTAKTHYDIPSILTKTDISYLFSDKNGNMWVGTGDRGLYRIPLQGGQNVHYIFEPQNNFSLSSNYVTAIYEDRKENLWVGTESGLNMLAEENKFIRFKYDVNNNNSLSHNRILTITEDMSGLIWIGTDGGGISRYNPQLPVFSHYTHQKGNPLSLSNPYVWSIYEDEKGILWLGTDWGLNQLDRKNQKQCQKFVYF